MLHKIYYKDMQVKKFNFTDTLEKNDKLKEKEAAI
jgi:hypothetical protein